MENVKSAGNANRGLTWLCSFVIAAYLLQLCSSQSSIGLSPPSALPPAAPDAHSTDPCLFSDRNSLIDRVSSDWIQYNISLLVSTCDGVCQYVFGTGNPDISGPGAMASYIIQGIASMLFGPLLVLTMILMDGQCLKVFASPNPTKNEFTILAVKLSQSVHQANILTAFAVSVAVLTRIQNAVPVAEISILLPLSSYQFILSAGSIISSSFLGLVTTGRQKVLRIYPLTTFGIMVAVVCVQKFPSSQSTTLAQLTTYCETEKDYTFANGVFQGPQITKDVWVDYLGGLGGLLVISVLVHKFRNSQFIRWALDVGQRIKGYVLRMFLVVCRLLGVHEKRFLVVLAWIALTAIYVGEGLYSFYWIQWYRENLKKVAGDAYQDSEWGFGQTTAVLLWAPFAHDLIVEGIATLYRVYKTKKQQGETPEVEMEGQKLASHPIEAASQQSRHSNSDEPQPGPRENTENLHLTPIREERVPSVGLDDATSDNGTSVDTSDLVSSSAHSISTANRPTSGEAQEFHRRTTWPRNPDGTYLPTQRPG